MKNFIFGFVFMMLSSMAIASGETATFLIGYGDGTTGEVDVKKTHPVASGIACTDPVTLVAVLEMAAEDNRVIPAILIDGRCILVNSDKPVWLAGPEDLFGSILFYVEDNSGVSQWYAPPYVFGR